uniref:Splicing factor Cactin n=1 Tax=Albugo laibachii Nc14 TaxID=890382 RepID=F0WF36_9STRA|nr:conserved hypothetical protein [Albugo laibachii Nc14]|eukprot:CCA19818.1 conserved hypothetical protein [Albugo laibachii Nc14]
MMGDQKNRKDKKRDKKARKRHRSSSESSSESRNGRKDRRLKKESKKAAKLLATIGYTNDINPFGDTNLTEPFVWSKMKKDARKVTTRKKSSGDRIKEIQQARARREQREAERQEIDRLRNEEMRLRDADQFQDWQKKEEEFHLQQTQVRSHLRIQQRREEPIDALAKNLLLFTQIKQDSELELDEVEMKGPYRIIQQLSLEELVVLKDNIQMYIELEETNSQSVESQEKRAWITMKKEYWELTMLLCCDLVRRRNMVTKENERHVNPHGAIHDSVYENIVAMLSVKTPEELYALAKEVAETIATAESSVVGIDVEYWEEVAKQIRVFQARAKLTRIHADILKELRGLKSSSVCEDEDVPAVDTDEEKVEERDVLGQLIDNSGKAREWLQMEKEKRLEEEEEPMDGTEEVQIAETPNWTEKYRPRKPRYFNRVKTGYEWNKYNQTHYDHDNPPPKVVQGYKFNLFYPDLIDATKAPRFFLEKTNSPEFCIIRFSAGPPYFDIAFKIVNREWEYSHKRGFKSVFERGILHLYFNFKRHRYRR